MDRPIIYGHRGAPAHSRENTVEAFALAIEQGADGVELGMGTDPLDGDSDGDSDSCSDTH